MNETSERNEYQVMATRKENWISIKWIGGRYDGIVYDINKRNVNTKPPFKIGQIVGLKKLKGARPGQKGEIIRAEKSLLEGKCTKRKVSERTENENDLANKGKPKQLKRKGKDIPVSLIF